ncbi:MAG: cob(I)yrinic acid a,c-diamide adenosyltransferase, partial [Dehalococcoidales bacterium]|nr:cob(I)yrinic acid a,c-diamide adenosyltransferase [Dehalococcoidales bacterium]
DLIVLDEINVASGWGLIDVEAVVKLIQDRPSDVELVMTGRDAHPRLVELADMVSEIHKIKHPYDKGILARKGLDY